LPTPQALTLFVASSAHQGSAESACIAHVVALVLGAIQLGAGCWSPRMGYRRPVGSPWMAMLAVIAACSHDLGGDRIPNTPTGQS
jgi:hypothetical protein